MCFLIVILLVIFLLLYLWMPHLVSFSAAYPGPGCGGSRFSSEAQTLLATFTLAQEDFKAFPNQLWDIISPVSPRSASASPPRWTYLHHLPREVSKGHPGYFPPKKYQLVPLDMKQHELYFEPLLDMWAPHPQTWAQQPWGESSFYNLILSVISNHNLITTGEGWTVDRVVIWKLNLLIISFHNHHICIQMPALK